MDRTQILKQAFVFVAILLVIGVEVATARGGRGGGGARGGSRFSGSRLSGSRSSRSRSSSIAWKTAVVAGAYYGSRRYTTRQRYRDDRAPEICENYELIRENSTAVYGKFICPLGDQPDNYEYCCGPAGKETCCRFFDDAGRTAGVVIGILLFFGLIGLIIFCCVRCQKNKKNKTKHNSHAMDSNWKKSVPPTSTYPTTTYPSAGYPQTTTSGYPAAEYTKGYPPADTAPMPPSYEASGGLPYSPNPTAGGANGLPYSLNPAGNTYSDPNMPGQGYSAPTTAPPAYVS